MSISKVLFLTLLLAVAGCDDDDDNPVGGNPTDTKAPGIASVRAIDANQIELKFNEDVEAQGAETIGNYTVIETAGTNGNAVDTLTVNAAVLGSDDRTVLLFTSGMNSAPYRIEITGVQDVAGNVIQNAVTRSFNGTDNPDTTPPELMSSNPANDARDVATDQSIELVFSEPISVTSLIAGTTWSSDLGNVPFSVSTDDSLRVTLIPTNTLEPDTRYTLNFDALQDVFGNVMSAESISFTTVTPQ